MSHDENMQTKPTIETLMERVNQLGDNLQNRLNSLQTDVTAIKSDVGSLKSDVGSVKSDVSSVKSDVIALRNEFQLFRGEMEIRIDRVEGMTNQTRAEMLNLRADFREWKDLLNASEA
jgi:archaellum component FlaC